MSSGDPAAAEVRSTLEKPLAELTEEDIAQITREDCRRFLKQKGMRRPSWNKSQAIQQVISLKALLEGRPGVGDPPVSYSLLHKSPLAPPPPPAEAPSAAAVSPHVAPSSEKKDASDGDSPSLSPSPAPLPPPPPTEQSPYRRRDPAPQTVSVHAAPSLEKEVSCGSPASPPPPKEPYPYRRRDPVPPVFSVGEPSSLVQLAGKCPPPPENRCLTPRNTADPLDCQMTIFYDGKVNVYEGVAPDKARAIMQLAGSCECYDLGPVPVQPDRTPPPRFPSAVLGPGLLVQPASPVAGNFPPSPAGAAGKVPRFSRESTEEWRPPRERETESEGPTSRKASLQRYLEKRKDRFKGKRVIGVPSPTSMDIMYLNQKIRTQISNEALMNNYRGDIVISPNQPRLPPTPTRSSSMQSQAGKVCFSFDLNDEAGGN